MAENVLEISTGERTRRTIAIDGSSYQLRDPDELTLQQQFGLTAVGKKAEKLSENPTEAEVAEIGAALKNAVKIVVVDLPDAVLDGLNDSQRVQILGVFPRPAQKAPAAPAGKANGAS